MAFGNQFIENAVEQRGIAGVKGQCGSPVGMG
jgi:hypothetical protein